jgi:Sec-independent protein translocase protein TatA
LGKAVKGFQDASREFEEEFKREAARIEEEITDLSTFAFQLAGRRDACGQFNFGENIKTSSECIAPPGF